ncbi:MAG: hypothetical protein MASP_00513 [Candidatus Methanolliviera sp. GoM_asphalt]|nr:MAG: hypothetical protein MASP_00513 [Candidatus Methanolliviera sp. GoM_asphalt]
MNKDQKANIERKLSKSKGAKVIVLAIGAWGILVFATYLFVEGSPKVGMMGIFTMTVVIGWLLNEKIEKIKDGMGERQEIS